MAQALQELETRASNAENWAKEERMIIAFMIDNSKMLEASRRHKKLPQVVSLVNKENGGLCVRMTTTKTKEIFHLIIGVQNDHRDLRLVVVDVSHEPVVEKLAVQVEKIICKVVPTTLGCSITFLGSFIVDLVLHLF